MPHHSSYCNDPSTSIALSRVAVHGGNEHNRIVRIVSNDRMIKVSKRVVVRNHQRWESVIISFLPWASRELQYTTVDPNVQGKIRTWAA